MTDSTTTNYGWSYPTVGADSNTWGTTLNNTIIAIDAQMALVPGKNRLVNGDFRVSQYNGSSSVTLTAGASAAYVIDRHYASCTGANVTAQQVAGPTGYLKAWKYTGAASVTGIIHGQRIESANCADLVSQSVTLSATISNSVLTTVTWTAYYANATDNFSSKTQIATGTWTVSSTDTRYSATFNAGANAGNGIAIELSVGAQTSGTWKITGEQLELGSVATSFERRPYGQELSLCQRYYWQTDSSFTFGLPALAYGTSTAITFFNFPVKMRVAPTVTLPAAGTGTGSMFTTATTGNPGTVGTHSVDNITTQSIRILGAGYTGAWSAAGTAIMFNIFNPSVMTLSAEL